MSDLTATNCGCNDSCGCAQNNNGWGGCNSWIWIILLLSCCNGGGFFGNNGCGCNNNCGCNNDCGCGNGLFGGNSSCSWLIWILLISCFCGGNNGCGC